MQALILGALEHRVYLACLSARDIFLFVRSQAPYSFAVPYSGMFAIVWVPAKALGIL